MREMACLRALAPLFQKLHPRTFIILTITSLIAIVGAITGHSGVQFTENTPVAHSPVQEIKVLDDTKAIAHSSASEEGCKVRRLALPTVFKKWKVRTVRTPLSSRPLLVILT